MVKGYGFPHPTSLTFISSGSHVSSVKDRTLEQCTPKLLHTNNTHHNINTGRHLLCSLEETCYSDICTSICRLLCLSESSLMRLSFCSHGCTSLWRWERFNPIKRPAPVIYRGSDGGQEVLHHDEGLTQYVYIKRHMLKMRASCNPFCCLGSICHCECIQDKHLDAGGLRLVYL